MYCACAGGCCSVRVLVAVVVCVSWWRVRVVVPPAPAHVYSAERAAAELFNRGVPARKVKALAK